MTSDLPGTIFKIYAKQNKQKGWRAQETDRECETGQDREEVDRHAETPTLGGGGGGKRHTTRKRSRETARKRSESGGQTEIKGVSSHDSTVMARSSSSRQTVLRSTPLTLLITAGRLSHKVY